MELKEGQVVEVEYNKELIEEDIKAQEEQNVEMLEQDEFNTDSIDEILGEGAELDG